ncbi:unnamed protein product, partial [Polarella glacialis]
ASTSFVVAFWPRCSAPSLGGGFVAVVVVAFVVVVVVIVVVVAVFVLPKAEGQRRRKGKRQIEQRQRGSQQKQKSVGRCTIQLRVFVPMGTINDCLFCRIAMGDVFPFRQ